MTESETTIAAAACQTLAVRFWNSIDERDYDGMVALFAPGGVWVRRGKELKAPSDILAAMAERSPTLVIRHVVTNVDVRVTAADAAEAFYYLTVYHHEAGKPVEKPVPLHGPRTIMIVRDRFTRTAEGWRILRKETRREFAVA